MIFMCSNRTIYIQPLFGGTYNTPWFPVMFTAECLTVLIAFLLSLYFSYILATIQIWHKNFNCLVVSVAFAFTGSSIANGLLLVDVWQGEYDSCSWRVEVSSIFLIFYCAYVIHCSIAALCERFFALLYLQDYERKSRLHLPVIMLTLTFIMASVATVLVSKKIINGLWYMIYLAGVVLASTPGYFLLWKLNSILYNKMENNPKPGEYTLSKKFQLKENIKVFRLTRNTVFALIASFIGMSILLFFSGSKVQTDEKYMPSQLSISQILIVTVAIFSSQKWKAFTVNYLPIKRWTRVEPSLPSPSAFVQREIYFKNLEKSWDKVVK